MCGHVPKWLRFPAVPLSRDVSAAIFPAPQHLRLLLRNNRPQSLVNESHFEGEVRGWTSQCFGGNKLFLGDCRGFFFKDASRGWIFTLSKAKFAEEPMQKRYCPSIIYTMTCFSKERKKFHAQVDWPLSGKATLDIYCRWRGKEIAWAITSINFFGWIDVAYQLFSFPKKPHVIVFWVKVRDWMERRFFWGGGRIDCLFLVLRRGVSISSLFSIRVLQSARRTTAAWRGAVLFRTGCPILDVKPRKPTVIVLFCYGSNVEKFLIKAAEHEAKTCKKLILTNGWK